MVKCKCISPLMLQTHGETGFFDIHVARELERKGMVEIMELPKSNLGVEQETDYIYKEKFENKGAVKIAWVQDYDKDGGAELSNYLVVKVGRLLGLDIIGVTPKNLNLPAMQAADIIILNNFFNFGDKVTQQILKICYDGKAPVVKYEHDHREINERKVQAERMFGMTTLNVFISPLQMRNHIAAFGEAMKERSIALPLAIDTEKYTCTNATREAKTVLVPAFNKSTDNTLDYIVKHPENTYTIIGRYDAGKKNIKSIIKVEPSTMPGLYNKHETVLHLPEKIEGGARIVFEAVLCGCKIIANANCAHLTWDEQFNWREPSVLKEKLASAPYEFWKAVCRLKQ